MVTFTESWLHSGIKNAELGFCDFDVFRCDRPPENVTSRGGGTLIATRKSLRGRLLLCSRTDFEKLFVECNLGNVKIIFGAIYIPPSSPLAYYESLGATLESLYPLNSDIQLFLMGDFNLPHIYWQNISQMTLFSTDDDTSVSNCTAANTLCNFVNFFNLKQHNYILNSDLQSLDLIFATYNHLNVTLETIYIEPVDVYHPPLSFLVSVTMDSVSEPRYMMYLDLRGADYTMINAVLNNITWDEVMETGSVTTAVQNFTNIIYTIFDNYIPHKLKKLDSFPHWYDGTLKRLIYY